MLCNDELGLWVVADGVGGNAHGDVASQLVVQTIERRVRQGSSLVEALEQANDALVGVQKSQDGMSSMATTVVACLFHENHFELTWIGDSRAYLLDQTGIQQLSSDHNLANELFNQGSISEDELRSHSGQHELTQALGQMSLSDIPLSLGELQEGDTLLLCSDGLSGPVNDEDIHRIVMSAPDIQTAAKSLLDNVLAAGAPDNVSIVLVERGVASKTMKASDFKQTRARRIREKFEGSFRFPVNKAAYKKHLAGRPILLALMLLAIVFLIVFI